MPYTVEWDGVGLVKQLSGHVTAAEFSLSADAVTSHPNFDRAKYVINDFSAATETDLPAALEHVAVMRIGASYSRPGLRVAYVSRCEAVRSFVAALQSERLACGWETRVFQTVGAARAWALRHGGA